MADGLLGTICRRCFAPFDYYFPPGFGESRWKALFSREPSCPWKMGSRDGRGGAWAGEASACVSRVRALWSSRGLAHVAVPSQVDSEEPVFEAVLAWVKHAGKEREESLPELLQYVRMPLLTPRYITDVVDAEVRRRVPSGRRAAGRALQGAPGRVALGSPRRLLGESAADRQKSVVSFNVLLCCPFV